MGNLDTSGSEKSCYCSHNRFQLKRRAMLGKLRHGIILAAYYTEYLKIELRKKIPFLLSESL